MAPPESSTIVSRNPSEVCTVSAVPTAWPGTDSVTSALNCALSATTKNPHTSASGASIHNDAPKRSRRRAQHAPLATSEIVTSRSRSCGRRRVRPRCIRPADRNHPKRDQRYDRPASIAVRDRARCSSRRETPESTSRMRTAPTCGRGIRRSRGATPSHARLSRPGPTRTAAAQMVGSFTESEPRQGSRENRPRRRGEDRQRERPRPGSRARGTASLFRP